MKKLAYVMTSGLLASAILLGCQKEDTEAKKQLAQMQQELEEQKRITAEMQAKALKEQSEKEQAQAEHEQEELQKEIEQKGQNKETNNQAQKAPAPTQRDASTQEEKAQSAPPKPQPKKITEKIVRYPATVVTSSGYGQLSLRGEPSTKGIEVGVLDDGDEVLVTAKTSKCEVIGRVEGCWVKVDINGIKGYMFDGYLNREVLSQAEKENLYGGQEGQDEYTY